MKDLKINQLIITTFIISWIGVIPSLLKSYNISLPPLLNSLELLMTLGPILVALFFTYKTKKWKGIKELFKQFLKIKAPFNVILLVLSLPFLASFLGAHIGLNLSHTPWPKAFTSGTILSRAVSIFIMYLIINTEEIMWRGLVFNKWLQKYGYMKASLMLAPVWWLFHVPYFFFKNGHPAGYGLAVFTIMVFSMTFILGWVYMKTNGSLFYAHILHQLINGFGEAFPIFPIFIGGALLPTWVMTLTLFLVATVIIITNYKKVQINFSTQKTNTP